MTNLPVTGEFKVTSFYGQQGKYWANGHKGIDFSGSYNRTVYSACDGVVEVAGWDSTGFGNYIRVRDNTNKNKKFYYGHLSKFNVKVGDVVNRNTVLGIMGNTGKSDGVHLHFEIRENGVAINPASYMGIPNVQGIYNSCNFQIKDAPKAIEPIILTVNTLVSPLKLFDLNNWSVKALMPKGSKVKLIEEVNANYYIVEYNGIRGFAPTGYPNFKYLK